MFTKLMDDLCRVYTGDTIYVPEKLRVFLEPWLHQQVKGKGSKFQRSGFQSSAKDFTDGYGWKNKKVLFFCEDHLTMAYKKMPVPHMPEKIMEEAFTIEFTLEEQTAKRRSSKPWQDTGVKRVKRERKQKGGKLW